MVYQFSPGCPCCYDCFYMWYYAGTGPVPDKDSDSILWKSKLGQIHAEMDSSGDVYTVWRHPTDPGVYIRRLSGTDGSIVWEVPTGHPYNYPSIFKVFDGFLYVQQKIGTSSYEFSQYDLNGNKLQERGWRITHLQKDNEGKLYFGIGGTAYKMDSGFNNIWSFTTYPGVYPAAFGSDLVFLAHQQQNNLIYETVVRILQQSDIIDFNNGEYEGNPWVQKYVGVFPEIQFIRAIVAPDPDHCIIAGIPQNGSGGKSIMKVYRGNDEWPYEEGDSRPSVVWSTNQPGAVDRFALIGGDVTKFYTLFAESAGSYLSKVNSSGVEWVNGYWEGVRGAGSNGSNTVIVGNPGSSIQPGCRPG